MHQPSRRRKTYLIASGLLLIATFSLLSFSHLFGLEGEGGGIGGISLDKLSSHFQGSRPPYPDDKHPPPHDDKHSPHHDDKHKIHEEEEPSIGNGLTEQDFNPNHNAYSNFDNLNRYESVDSWRSLDSFTPTFPPAKDSRPKVPHWSKYATKGEYLKQPLVADYADGAENIFLMIKTGGDVLWNRLPIHLVTTLTRVPNFALYADKPGSVGGYEVIDILANVTDETLQSPAFDKYRKMKYLHNQHNIIDASQVKIDGGWELDKFKNIPMLQHAYSVSPKSDWFVFMDADSFIMMDVMTKWLKTINPNEVLYMGSAAMYGDLPFAHGGSVVVLSRKALEETVGSHPEYVQEYEKKAFSNCCGDVLVGQMLQEKLKKYISTGPRYPWVHYRFQGNSFYDAYVSKDNWCEQIQTFHHLTAHEIEILYEYERLRGPNRDSLTYYDIYRDFYLPYIDEKMEHWNNLASAVEWTKEKAEKMTTKEGVIPYESFESCKIACEATDWCVSFRHIPDKQYCGLSGSIQLGKPILDWPDKEKDKNKNTDKDKDEYHDITSGFLIKRIRDFRKDRECDILHGSGKEEHPDGGENDFYEGWFLRRTKKEEEKRVKAKLEHKIEDKKDHEEQKVETKEETKEEHKEEQKDAKGDKDQPFTKIDDDSKDNSKDTKDDSKRN